MLSNEDNELLCRVGRGTPMGRLMRRFWLPALLEEEVAKPDGAPVRLRLLGEDLVVFRDTDNRVGIISAYCAHRRAGLFFGRNEKNGIRCVYHGWKYDVDGKCMDVPSEPVDTGYKNRVKITAYKSAVRGGVVWVYMGNPDDMPELPDFEWARLPKMQRTVTKRMQRTNWTQAVEGGIDSSHVSFLHGHTTKVSSGVNFQDSDEVWKYLEMDQHPVFSVNEADYGLLIHARRNAEPGTYYWRITQFLLPFYTLTPPTVDPQDSEGAAYYGHAWVPIDDENCWTWSFHANPKGEFSEREREYFGGRNGFWGPVDEHYMPLLNMENDYRIDREKQRTENFTGIAGIQNQDAAVQESMGPIVDRTEEMLGHSDLAIVRFRRRLLRAAREMEQGRPPKAAQGGALYNVRPATLLLPQEVPADEGAAQLMRGGS
jgi:nitrite reductase/ring-hydroxylating ferredoxin subunit